MTDIIQPSEAAAGLAMEAVTLENWARMTDEELIGEIARYRENIKSIVNKLSEIGMHKRNITLGSSNFDC